MDFGFWIIKTGGLFIFRRNVETLYIRDVIYNVSTKYVGKPNHPELMKYTFWVAREWDKVAKVISVDYKLFET